MNSMYQARNFITFDMSAEIEESVESLKFTLNSEQQHVVDAVMAGSNVFISGPAGVGKSFIISYICDRMNKVGKTYRLLAPTGVAAINIGGRTIHSFLKIMPEVSKFLSNKVLVPICKASSKIWL